MSAGIEPKLVFHFAVADNGVIGKDNDMPWHISSDLKRFKQMTMGKPFIVGRRTFESFGRPLPGRTNIVVTRDEAFKPEGAVGVASLDEALDLARSIAVRDGVDEISVLGGGTIYKALWNRADRLQVTHIHAEPEGDTKLPPIDQSVWECVLLEPQEQGERDSAPFSYAVYERRRA